VLLSRTQIINYLKEYIAKKNFKLLLAEEVLLPPSLAELIDLIVRDGDNIIFFSIFFQKAFSDPQLRKLIYLELAKLSKLTSYANKVYLVLPEEYVKPTILDGKLFEDVGIGLISISTDGTVKEIIPARPFERALSIGISKDIKRKISALEEKILRVEETIKRYREDLDNVISSVRDLTNQLSRVFDEVNSLRAAIASTPLTARTQTLVSETEERVSIEVGEELPSFVKDNPWLLELSKRGRGE